ncbi:DUF3617 domain-containing protein [Dyella acidisoli]|uniref:DUF3617 domain-containing protein n=1 Tax=Dyella acidisoli TaxID=1867834 RepID=UPI003C2D0124
MRNQARSAFLLAIAMMHSGAFAQAPVKPGKWQLTGTFKGMPFGSDAEQTQTICLSEAALGSGFEKAMIEASPQPSNDASRPPPKCVYTQMRREGANSTWEVSCVSPSITGVGNATILSSEQVNLFEKLEVRTPFGSRSIQHTVRARRKGDCS